MKLNKKEYQIIKTKKYLKKNKLFFFLNGVDKNFDNYKTMKQNLDIITFNFFKIFNKITNKKLGNSVLKNMKEIINGPTFLIKPTTAIKIKKNVLFSDFCFSFLLLALKINNKIYPVTVLKKNINSIDYNNNILLFYQFSLINLKYYNIFLKTN